MITCIQVSPYYYHYYYHYYGSLRGMIDQYRYDMYYRYMW